MMHRLTTVPSRDRHSNTEKRHEFLPQPGERIKALKEGRDEDIL